MEFWSTIVGLLRRPKVVVPILLAALVLGAVAFMGTPVTYVSSTTMVLTTTQYGGSESMDPTEPTPLTNPMLNFNSSLATTSGILIQSISTKEALEELGATGGSTRLIVNDGRTNPELLGLDGPFLYVEGRSVSQEDARRVVEDAQKMLRKKLSEWQRDLNAPQKTYVSARRRRLADGARGRRRPADPARCRGVHPGDPARPRHRLLPTRDPGPAARASHRCSGGPAAHDPAAAPVPRTRTAVRASASRWWPRTEPEPTIVGDPAPAQPGTGHRQGDGPEGSRPTRSPAGRKAERGCPTSR